MGALPPPRPIPQLLQQRLNRRRLLTLAAGAGGAGLVAAWGLQRGSGGGGLQLPWQRMALPLGPGRPPDRGGAPGWVRAEGGLLQLDLVAEARNGPWPEGPRQVLTYNGLIPGPILELRPGDAVALTLVNRLDQPTNLHFHGLHISPEGQADNIFLSVPPGGRQTYRFRLPSDHPSGLFYYHPHRHGTVADQVFGGLGGAIVVRGGLDALPALAAMPEQVLILKDFPQRHPPSGWHPGPMGARMRGRVGPLLSVNGTLQPAVALPEAGWLRLRLLNAANARVFRLALSDGGPLLQISSDGGALEAPLPRRELLLAPGERADLLVASGSGQQERQLLSLPYSTFGRPMLGGPPHADRHQGQASAQLLLTLRDPGGQPPPPPTQLLPLAAIEAPVRQRRFRFSHGMRPGHGMQFLINGQSFDHHRVDAAVRLGEIEEWELINTGMMDHPFHLHVHGFQVVAYNGGPPPAALRTWKDTVLLQPGDQLRIRIPFRDFSGRTVFHCHNLDHEDLGMMGLIEVSA